MEFTPASRKFITIVLTAMLSISVLVTAAEDGTSGTLPESFHECEIVEAQWSASEASPEASPQATPMATPVASPIASPVVEDDPLTEDLEVATHTILECMSENNLEVLLEVTGKDFRGTWIGLGSSVSDEDFEILLPMMAKLPYQLVDIQDAEAEGDTATAVVRYIVGRQLFTTEWTYELVDVDGLNVWQVQAVTMLPTEVPDSASEMQIVINDGAFKANTTTIDAGDIVINVMNAGEMPHEVLIVRAPAGTEAADFAASTTGIPQGGTFVAQVIVPAGTQGNIVLTDVRAGTYTIVDLLPGEDGLPNVSDGMIIEITVE